MTKLYLIACYTSTSSDNTCDWIWHRLNKFLDVGHIRAQTLPSENCAVGPDLVDAFAGKFPFSHAQIQSLLLAKQ